MDAHSRYNAAGKIEYQSLYGHLSEVSRRAARFAELFQASEWASLAGILHDAGKASEGFQARIHGSSVRVAHSTLGAQIARDQYELLGMLLAYAIAGHHGGLPDGIGGQRTSRTPLDKRLLEETDCNVFLEYASSSGIMLPNLESLPDPFAGSSFRSFEHMRFSCYVLTKMIHSCLVDADHLDTERFTEPEYSKIREMHYPSLSELCEKFDRHMEAIEFRSDRTSVNLARRAILNSCKTVAGCSSGLFSLTVPTGGGKTLAALGFALRHALMYGQQRIIFSIPFTSIVEQTAATYRSIFGDNAVLEHHSNYDLSDVDEESALRQRLAVQNWEAPIIVTTNVQLLESLFSSRPGRCRKIHNIANSVIILDEAQTLPDTLLTPSLAMFEELTARYNTSIVLCTATQPALLSRWPFGSETREIATDREAFDEAFGGRVEYEQAGVIGVEGLASELLGHNQALCIVNSRLKAREVYGALKSEEQEKGEGCEGIFHLSALMVPAHRSAVIEQIKSRLKDPLKNGERCLVVSTQLIEAGVDVDFPIVYRELAGLDSIVQAAGRCNREGTMFERGLGVGRVVLFDFEQDENASQRVTWLEKMKRLGKRTLEKFDGRVDGQAIEYFFNERYRTEEVDGMLDGEGVFAMLTSDGVGQMFEGYPFDTCSQLYKVIDDDGVSVFVPWGDEGRELYARLLKAENPAALTRYVQRYTVNIPKCLFDAYARDGLVDGNIAPFSIMQANDGRRVLYSEETGLLSLGKEERESLIH